VFLFFQTRSINIEQHNQRIDILLQLKQAEGRLDRDLLQVTSFLLVQYDPFVELQHHINALRRQMSDDELITDNRLFSDKLNLYLKAIDEKFELLEQLKSKAALIRNGLHYLPVIASQLQNAEPDAGIEVNLLLNQQYRHHLLPSFMDVTIISNRIAEVKNKYTQQVQSKDLFENVIFHMETNLKLISEMVSLRESYVDIPSYQRFDELYNYYTDYYSEKSRESEQYSNLLLIMTVILFAVLGYTLQKLNRAHRLSRRLHKQLIAAVNSISEAFALFAEDGKLILFNQKYMEFYPWLKGQIDANTTIDDITFANISEGMLIDNEKEGELEDFPGGELKSYQNKSYIEQLPDGRWFMANDSITSAGELVCVSTSPKEPKQK
jgi:PAS domain-containing protein